MWFILNPNHMYITEVFKGKKIKELTSLKIDSSSQSCKKEKSGDKKQANEQQTKDQNPKSNLHNLLCNSLAFLSHSLLICQWSAVDFTLASAEKLLIILIVD